MELQVISESISALAGTKALINKITDLENEFAIANQLFTVYKQKVKDSIQKKTKNYENEINSLQQKVEALQMVIFI